MIPLRVRVTDQKLYGEWTANEADGQVIVTRIEYGYLKSVEGEVRRGGRDGGDGHTSDLR